jgi:ribosomal protein S1
MEIIGHDSPKDLLKPGDEILVRVLDIDPERQRIGLSMTEVTYDEHVEWIQSREGNKADPQATPTDQLTQESQSE